MAARSLQDIFGAMLFDRGGSEDIGADPAAGAAAAGVGGDAALEAASPPQVEELPTLVVTREVKEHANVFHAFTGGVGQAGRGGLRIEGDMRLVLIRSA